jgi:Peptidase family M28
MSETALKHIEYLVNTIGPRGSTTEGEKKAHEYSKQTLEGLGYETHWEEYNSATSAWLPYTLALSLMVLADLIFYLGGISQNGQMAAVAAATLGLLSVISFFLQVTQRDNPLRWFLPVAKSQNVWASAKPTGTVRRRIVLTGHVDTHRVALAMQSPAFWQVFQILTTVLAIVNLALTALFIYGMFTPDLFIRQAALYLGILLIVGLVFTIHPDTQPYVKGANDNASGAAAVLALAEKLKAQPLANTEVYLVNTGCEEVGCYGLIDWVKRHAPEDARDADYLVLDNLAGKGAILNYVTEESVLVPVKADGRLITLASEVSQANPSFAAKPFVYKGLFSELTVASVLGQKALGLLNFDPKTKMPPLFHTLKDDFANIDPALLDQSEQFAWALIQKIDQS